MASATQVFDVCIKDIPEPFHSVISNQLGMIDQKMIPDHTDSELLEWCSGNPLLKIVYENITNVLIPDVSIQKQYGIVSIKIADVKVQPPRKERHLSDDKIYSENPDIQSNVPRGLSFIIIENTETVYIKKIIQGLRKFTGLEAGDDDDVNPESVSGKIQYSIGDESQVVSYHMSEKANGENGHFGVIQTPELLLNIPNIPDHLFVGGSKCVHCVIRNIDDMDHEIYQKQRFTFASIIMRSCMKSILASGNIEYFCGFMSKYMLTLTIELLNPNTQHIVLLVNKEPVAKALTFLSIKNVEGLELGLNPISSQYITSFFGFDPVVIQDIPLSDLSNALTTSRYGTESEGYVFYGIDAHGNVVHMYKRKTNWYVCLRAIRQRVIAFLISMEKSTKSKSEIIENGKKRVIGRIDEIQEWLMMSDEEIIIYKDIGCKFIEYVAIHKDGFTRDVIRNKFPLIMRDVFSTGSHGHDGSHHSHGTTGDASG